VKERNDLLLNAVLSPPGLGSAFHKSWSTYRSGCNAVMFAILVGVCLAISISFRCSVSNSWVNLIRTTNQGSGTVETLHSRSQPNPLTCQMGGDGGGVDDLLIRLCADQG
jgi:hypothetical protein